MSHIQGGQMPLLSKSRFMAGLQCFKRLYLECFNRDLADPIDEQQKAIFDTGTRVGELARGLYPGGLLIAEDHFHHDDAIVSTNSALSDPALPAIFEAAFQYGGIRIRTDILVRTDHSIFDLIEVKSSTQVKPENTPDVGVQLYVLNGCGIKIRRIYIGFINRDYVYQGGEYELDQLFNLEEVTQQSLQMQTGMQIMLDEMRRHLQDPEPPHVEVGDHCKEPYKCVFYNHCHADEPEHHVGQLPRASKKLLRSFKKAGIDDIRHIPENFKGLNDKQKRVRNCVVNDCIYVGAELYQHLQELKYPVHFLDFETFNPALPLYTGTRPYQIIPFQWSNHVLEKSGGLRHEEFLHEGPDDPREFFIISLIQTLGSKGSIVVYSSFEATRMRELAKNFPRFSKKLLALLEGRVVDLLLLIRNHCYHPAFHGSFSIKSVLPALVPDLDYNDLEINDGELASVAYAEMRKPETPPGRRNFLKKSLLEYCKRDSEAEVRLFNTLRLWRDKISNERT